MRRRDWKIKNLKKYIYGNKKLFRKAVKNKRLYFLRKLSMRKNKHSLKKNVMMHYIFLNNFLIDLKKLKLKSIEIRYLFKNYNLNLFHSDYSVKKYIFYNFVIFKDLEKNFSLFSIRNFKEYNNYGLTTFVFNNENSLIDQKEEFNSIINKKNDNNIDFFKFDINFFFNYNIYLLNSLEIYKILILLYYYNLKNK